MGPSRCWDPFSVQVKLERRTAVRRGLETLMLSCEMEGEEEDLGSQGSKTSLCTVPSADRPAITQLPLHCPFLSGCRPFSAPASLASRDQQPVWTLSSPSADQISTFQLVRCLISGRLQAGPVTARERMLSGDSSSELSWCQSPRAPSLVGRRSGPWGLVLPSAL